MFIEQLSGAREHDVEVLTVQDCHCSGALIVLRRTYTGPNDMIENTRC
jgi:hypothetical protein